MTITPTGGPAFPVPQPCCREGMTLRQWYAGLAMQGLLAADADLVQNSLEIAARAWLQADDMLETENK